MNDSLISAIIKKVADKQGKSEEEVKESLQKMIDKTWDSDDPKTAKRREKFFPEGKPETEELIQKIASKFSKKV